VFETNLLPSAHCTSQGSSELTPTTHVQHKKERVKFISKKGGGLGRAKMEFG